MGNVMVPGDRMWGAQTQRCLEYFKIGSEQMPFAVIRALVLVKKAAAQVIVFRPARVLMQDFAGVLAVADMVAMRMLPSAFGSMPGYRAVAHSYLHRKRQSFVAKRSPMIRT